MRLSIIIPDAMVVKNGMAHAGLDFQSAGIPTSVHALQWMGTEGMIEHEDANVETIATLPLWAEIALDLWEARDAALSNPAPTADQVRAERDSLLAASDWTQVADAPVDQAAWATYRQALRDVPDQAGFPEAVVWPVAPT